MGVVLLEALVPAMPGLTKASLLYDYLEKQEEECEWEKKKPKHADCYVLEATIWCLQGNAELAIDEPLGMTTEGTTSMHRILHGTCY